MIPDSIVGTKYSRNLFFHIWQISFYPSVGAGGWRVAVVYRTHELTFLCVANCQSSECQVVEIVAGYGRNTQFSRLYGYGSTHLQR